MDMYDAQLTGREGEKGKHQDMLSIRRPKMDGVYSTRDALHQLPLDFLSDKFWNNGCASCALLRFMARH
jgi:hypothetical protein